MKIKKYILFALTALLTVSCHDNGNWDEVDPAVGKAAYGNQSLTPSNLKTIAEVKDMFHKAVTTGDPELVTEYMQIQGIVIANDEGGNIYNAIYIKDATGAICISIKQSGLAGPYNVGQCVLVELKGLHLGNYGGQPQIGIYNVNQKNGRIQIYGMSRYLWQKHHKIIDPINGLDANPMVVNNVSELTVATDCNKLVTFKNIEIADADGKKVFASKAETPPNQSAVEHNIKGQNNLVIRTSTSAKIANVVMPTGKINLTGIASFYSITGKWQILIRDEKDIQPAQ